MESLVSILAALSLIFSFVVWIMKTLLQKAEDEARREAERKGNAPRPTPTVAVPAQPVPEPLPVQAQVDDSGQSLSMDGAPREGEDYTGVVRAPEAEVRGERTKEWNAEKIRTWDMPADVGSLGPAEASGESRPELIGATTSVFEESEFVEAPDEDDHDYDAVDADEIGWLVQESRPSTKRIQLNAGKLAEGVLWGVVLGPPRCRGRVDSGSRGV